MFFVLAIVLKDERVLLLFINYFINTFVGPYRFRNTLNVNNVYGF